MMLTAFQLPANETFPGGLSTALRNAGYRVEESSYALTAYRPTLEWTVPSIGKVLGGCRLQRLSGGSWIVVLPHWGIPGVEFTRAERAAVDKVVTTSRTFGADGRLSECFRLIHELDLLGLPECAPTSVADRGRVVLGSGSRPLAPVGLMDLRGTALRGPARRYLHCTSQVHTEERLKPFFAKIESSLGLLGIGAIVKQVDFGGFLESLSRLTREQMQDRSVILIGIPGSKVDQEPIPAETLQALDYMDALGIPYRIFGDPSLDSKYPAGDMAPYLGMLLGASVKELELAPAFANSLFLGLDLGHPLHRGDSVPVLSIVDARGRLLAWWRGRQIRDETLRRETLERAAAWLWDWLQTSPQRFSDFVVLRDGKSNKHDGLDELARVLPAPVTLVEVVKNPVPQMALDGVAAPPGTWIEVVRGRDGFLQMPEQSINGHMARPLRLRLLDSGGPHSLVDLAGAVFALCHAPTLGLRVPSAPAPVYWSDGLAARAGIDPQFRGLNHVPHHDELRIGK